MLVEINKKFKVFRYTYAIEDFYYCMRNIEETNEEIVKIYFFSIYGVKQVNIYVKVLE